MKNISVGNSFFASEISLGCWRTGNLGAAEMEALVQSAVNEEINFFDTANIYGGGRSEELLGAAISSLNLRDKVMIQTKCAIHDGIYDFSKKHILQAVEASLGRLKTEYIDVLLLHRPDTLMEPEEVAAAFDELEKSGKVRYFGVSNQKPLQMELLGKFVSQKLVANQLQFSLTNTGMIDSGLNVNTVKSPSLDHDGSVLEYCRLKDITIQAWSPLQFGFFEGTFLDNYEKYGELNKKLDEYSELFGITKAAVAFAWILRHPAKMQVVSGTTNPARVAELSRASEIKMSRAQWYELYCAAGNTLP